MTSVLPEWSADAAERFDAVIDVRSPSEFAEDHVPGAINLPVLDDAERAEIGTIYTQVSRFEARRRGAALVSRNIAAALDGRLAGMPRHWAPLIYCWRGGMRSNAFAHVIEQIGWRPTVVAGGYRAYRRFVKARLYDDPPPPRLVLLDGDTGAGKTALLHRLATRGLAVIDLEGLANHRGSLFGAPGGTAQPSQKAFESGLWDALRRAPEDGPIVIEAESSKVGARVVPPTLLAAMGDAPRIVVEAPARERARFTVSAYRDLVEDPDRLDALLAALTPLHGKAQVEAWRALAAAGDHEALALDLIERHYDPAYARARKRLTDDRLATVRAARLDAAGLDAAADAIAARIAARA